MEYIQSLGLSLVVLAYLVCGALTFNSKAKGRVRSTFIVSYLGVVLWALGYLFIQQGEDFVQFIPLLEFIFIGSWLLLLLAIMDDRHQKFRDFILSKYPLTLFLGLSALVFLYSQNIMTTDLRFKILIGTELLASIAGLLLLEQVYRSSAQEKWSFKPLVLGLSAANIFQLVMMSNALLLNAVDAQYVIARPYVFVLIAPMLLLSMKRVESWNLRVFVSREVVLHSSLLVFAGIYLMAMALTGYFIQQTGKEWTGVVQIIFVAGALVVLAYIFVSDSVRKYFRTFIQKHFYANQFDYREEWIALTSILDRANPEQDFYQVGLEGVLNSLHYERGCYAKIEQDTLTMMTHDPFKLSMEAMFELKVLARKLEQNHWLIDVSEFGGREYIHEFQGYSVVHLAGFEVEIIAPIFIDEKLHGVFVLASNGKEKVPLNWEVRDYLTAIGSQIGSYFRFCEARVKLEENAKFAAFNRMSAFVVHDLKNVIAQIGMIVDNGEKYRHIPEFIDDTFETLGHTKDRMDRMLSQLKEKQQQRSNHSQLDLVELLKTTVAEFERALPRPSIQACDQEIIVRLDNDRMISVIGHLIDNAQQATEDLGTVTLEVSQTPEAIKITISDSGIGMTQDFIDNQLFKPFETTKGNAGMGVGVYEAKTYAEELGGALTVESEVGRGTTFTMTLPLRNISG